MQTIERLQGTGVWPPPQTPAAEARWEEQAARLEEEEARWETTPLKSPPPLPPSAAMRGATLTPSRPPHAPPELSAAPSAAASSPEGQGGRWGVVRGSVKGGGGRVGGGGAALASGGSSGAVAGGGAVASGARAAWAAGDVADCAAVTMRGANAVVSSLRRGEPSGVPIGSVLASDSAGELRREARVANGQATAKGQAAISCTVTPSTAPQRHKGWGAARGSVSKATRATASPRRIGQSSGARYAEAQAEAEAEAEAEEVAEEAAEAEAEAEEAEVDEEAIRHWTSQWLRDVDDAFARIDRNCDGVLSRAEVIKACRIDPHVRTLLGLPERIRQEDGTRDAFEKIFQRLDQDDSKAVTLDEFKRVFGSAAYLRQRQQSFVRTGGSSMGSATSSSRPQQRQPPSQTAWRQSASPPVARSAERWGVVRGSVKGGGGGSALAARGAASPAATSPSAPSVRFASSDDAPRRMGPYAESPAAAAPPSPTTKLSRSRAAELDRRMSAVVQPPKLSEAPSRWSKVKAAKESAEVERRLTQMLRPAPEAASSKAAAKESPEVERRLSQMLRPDPEAASRRGGAKESPEVERRLSQMLRPDPEAASTRGSAKESPEVERRLSQMLRPVPEAATSKAAAKGANSAPNVSAEIDRRVAAMMR